LANANPLEVPVATDDEEDAKLTYEEKQKEAWKKHNVTVNSIKKVQEAHENKFGYPKKSLA
jgi:hypothetical protein